MDLKKKKIVLTTAQSSFVQANNPVYIITQIPSHSLYTTSTQPTPCRKLKHIYGQDGIIQKNRSNEYNYKNLLKEFEDFERMLESGDFSDIKLVVNNHEIKAHKNILAARSQYFSDILTRQDCLKSMEFEDIDYETLKIVIRFMYCGKLDDLDLESAKKVLVAAKNYVSLGLIEKCKKIIIDQLTVNNVTDIAYFSQMIEEEDITNCVIDFLKRNIRILQEDVLKKFNSEILAKVILKIIDQ